MQINISPATEAVITQLVAGGSYSSAEEVVEKAVALIDLKRKIDEGLQDIVDGRVAPLDMAAIKRQVIDQADGQVD